jgi:hypothetical protein
MAEQTFDARRMAHDQESRMAAAAAVGLHAIKYQASFLRIWADNAELLARNYEKDLEIFSAALRNGGDVRPSGFAFGLPDSLRTIPRRVRRP